MAAQNNNPSGIPTPDYSLRFDIPTLSTTNDIFRQLREKNRLFTTILHNNKPEPIKNKEKVMVFPDTKNGKISGKGFPATTVATATGQPKTGEGFFEVKYDDTTKQNESVPITRILKSIVLENNGYIEIRAFITAAGVGTELQAIFNVVSIRKYTPTASNKSSFVELQNPEYVRDYHNQSLIDAFTAGFNNTKTTITERMRASRINTQNTQNVVAFTLKNINGELYLVNIASLPDTHVTSMTKLKSLKRYNAITATPTKQIEDFTYDDTRDTPRTISSERTPHN